MIENLLQSIDASQIGTFSWLNEVPYQKLGPDTIEFQAAAQSDFFIDPAGEHVANNAAFLHLDVKGDFRVQSCVRHDFISYWDAAAIMVRDRKDRWAKLCFEATDVDTKAVVSVVTDGVSDDANGINYPFNKVWLQIVRQGNVFAFHYGPDGEDWNMVRYFRLDAEKSIQVGMVAQCPAGKGASIRFHSFALDHEPIHDLRAGI